MYSNIFRVKSDCATQDYISVHLSLGKKIKVDTTGLTRHWTFWVKVALMSYNWKSDTCVTFDSKRSMTSLNWNGTKQRKATSVVKHSQQSKYSTEQDRERAKVKQKRYRGIHCYQKQKYVRNIAWDYSVYKADWEVRHSQSVQQSIASCCAESKK